MTRSTTRLLAASAGAMAVIGTFAASTPSYGGQERSGPMAGAPQVGRCEVLTMRQASRENDHGRVVHCTKPHTAEVAGVVTLPSSLNWSSATMAQLNGVIDARCLPLYGALLGRSTRIRDTSAYEPIWFEPTVTQRSAGARWLSCDVVRPAGPVLDTLPTSTKPFLPDGKLGNAIARCLTKAVYDTPCSATHLWRATGKVLLSLRYPGAKELNRQADNDCRGRVIRGRPYRWTYRDKLTWNLEPDRVIVCYSQTSS